MVQLFSNEKKTVLINENNPKYIIKYAFYVTILNLLRCGNYSLALTFVKILDKLLFHNENKYDYSRENENFSIETIKTLTIYLFELFSYDPYLIGEKLFQIITTDNENKDFITKLLCIKFFFLTGSFHLLQIIDFPSTLRKENLYYYLTTQYYRIICKDQNEVELIEFKNYCKNLKYNKLYNLVNLKISQNLMFSNKITESILLCKKIIFKNYDESILLKAKILLANCLSRIDKCDDSLKILDSCEEKLYSNGDIQDKYEFYLLKSQLLIKENHNHNNYNLNNYPFFYDNILKCFENAILSNNSEFIQTSICLFNFILNSQQFTLNKIKNIVKNHLEKLDKLLNIFSKFYLNSLQIIELIVIINQTAIRTLEKIKNIIIAV
jgi:hypothetical protein